MVTVLIQRFRTDRSGQILHIRIRIVTGDPSERQSFTRTRTRETTPYPRSFRSRFFAYHYAANHPHTHIILSWFSIPLVLKCAANILKIGLQIKIKRPNMCLNRNFCMKKLLAREVTIFPEKIRSCKILLKIYKTNTKL